MSFRNLCSRAGTRLGADVAYTATTHGLSLAQDKSQQTSPHKGFIDVLCRRRRILRGPLWASSSLHTREYC